LVEVLHETKQRLEEMTAGNVDAVVDRHGRTFLLRRHQKQLRHIAAPIGQSSSTRCLRTIHEGASPR
jgi:hypothetical protein